MQYHPTQTGLVINDPSSVTVTTTVNRRKSTTVAGTSISIKRTGIGFHVDTSTPNQEGSDRNWSAAEFLIIRDFGNDGWILVDTSDEPQAFRWTGSDKAACEILTATVDRGDGIQRPRRGWFQYQASAKEAAVEIARDRHVLRFPLPCEAPPLENGTDPLDKAQEIKDEVVALLEKHGLDVDQANEILRDITSDLDGTESWKSVKDVTWTNW